MPCRTAQTLRQALSNQYPPYRFQPPRKSTLKTECTQLSEFPLTVSPELEYFPHKMLREEQTDSGDLIQGTLEMLVLKALTRGPLHGYAVAEWIHQTSQQLLKVEEGALYPALHRLELRGLLKAEWGASENNRRAKFYQLTSEGKKKLIAESQRWARLSAAVAFVMQAS
jgi:PadR family transcriptional regulator, regulatory protein PadR